MNKNCFEVSKKRCFASRPFYMHQLVTFRFLQPQLSVIIKSDLAVSPKTCLSSTRS